MILISVSLDQLLKEILIRNTHKSIEADEITTETDLMDDLALDSILVVHLFAELEEQFNIALNPEDLTKPILSRYSLLREFVMERMDKGESWNGD